MLRSRFVVKTLFAAAVLGMTTWSSAGSLDPAKVPADAKWVMHLDLERLTNSKVIDIVRQKLPAKQLQKFEDQMNAVDAIAGMKLRKDLTDATMYSRGEDEKDAVLVLSGNLNQTQLVTLLKANESYAESPYGTHVVMSWSDDDDDHKHGKHADDDKDDDKSEHRHARLDAKFGAFFNAHVAVVGGSKETVTAALDLLDGKQTALDVKVSKLAPPKAMQDAGLLFYIAADAVKALQAKAKSPVISQIESGWMSVSEGTQQLSVLANVDMKSAESATQLRTFLEGLRAIASLATKDGDEDARAAINLIQSANLSVNGASVKLDWPISFDAIGKLAEKAAVHIEKEDDDDDKSDSSVGVKVKVKVGD